MASDASCTVTRNTKLFLLIRKIRRIRGSISSDSPPAFHMIFRLRATATLHYNSFDDNTLPRQRAGVLPGKLH
jgi:hypothetical protein